MCWRRSDSAKRLKSRRRGGLRFETAKSLQTAPRLDGPSWNALAARGGDFSQKRFLKRQLVSPVSQLCVSRSGMAVVILASPNT
jgi:hypothetical protein